MAKAKEKPSANKPNKDVAKKATKKENKKTPPLGQEPTPPNAEQTPNDSAPLLFTSALVPSFQDKFWEKQILTQSELAFMIGVSTDAVDRLVKEFGLPCRQVGESKLFSLYQVVQWIEQANK